MPAFTTIVAFLLGSLVYVVIPGPSMLFILGRAIALGRRAALATAVGNLVGVVVLVGAVSIGVETVIERAAVVLTVIKLVGGVYLVWLGIQAYRHRGTLTASTQDPSAAQHPSRAAREGAVVGLTNPKAIVFFGAVIPQLVDPSRPSPGLQVLVLGLIFCVLAFMMDVIWTWLASTARDWLAGSPARLRRLGGAGGLIMIGMGLGVVATGRQS